jgi:predicted membrane protein
VRIPLPALAVIALATSLTIALNTRVFAATASSLFVVCALTVHVVWFGVFLGLSASVGLRYRLRSTRMRALVAIISAPVILYTSTVWPALLFAVSTTAEAWALASEHDSFARLSLIVSQIEGPSLLGFVAGYGLLMLFLLGKRVAP